MEIIAVGDEVGANRFGKEKSGLQSDLEHAEMLEPDAFDSDAERGVVSKMAVDDEEPFPPGEGGPAGDLADGLDEGRVAQRKGPRPFRGMTRRDRDGERR